MVARALFVQTRWPEVNALRPALPLMVLATAGKIYSRPLRQQLRTHLVGWTGEQLGPVTHGAHRVALRFPRLADAEAWRFLRLRDQRLIEPFWVTSTQCWAQRHTEHVWVEEVLSARKDARAGRAL